MPLLVAAQPQPPQQQQPQQQQQQQHQDNDGLNADLQQQQHAAAELQTAQQQAQEQLAEQERAAEEERERMRREEADRAWEAMTAATWSPEATAAWEAAALAGAEAAQSGGAGAAALSSFYASQEPESLLAECARRGVPAPPNAAREALAGSLLRTFFCAASCVLCLESDLQVGSGIECSPGLHFVCSRCLAAYVEAEAAAELSAVRARRGRLFCPLRRGNGGCTAPPFAEAALASAVPMEVFQAHLAAAARTREAELAQQMEADYAKRLGRELARAEEERRLGAAAGAAAARVEPHRRRCAEEVLTLSCPRCKQAFCDFGAKAGAGAGAGLKITERNIRHR